MRTLRCLSLLALVPALVFGAGCKESLTGPEPSLPSAETLPADPGIICREQHPEEGTPIVVTGTNLSPVPFDVPKESKTALPSVTLVRSADVEGGDAEAAEVFYGGQPGEANAELLSWQSQTQMTLHVTDALELGRGIYDIRVQNPQGAEASTAGALAVVNRPSVSAVAPGITCLAQDDRTVTVTGQEILRVGDLRAEAVIGGNSYPVDELSDCVAVAHEGLDAEVCATATVTLPAADLDAGTHPVEFQNPETAACKSDHEVDQIDLLLVDPPEITGAEPPLICTDEMDRALTLQGTNFFTVDGALPSVMVGGSAATVDGVGGCEAVDVVGLDVQNCTEINITVSQGSLAEGDVEISVENPGPIGCSSSATGVLTIPPTVGITAVTPATVCSNSAGMMDLVVTGVGFLTIDGAPFSVTFDGAAVTPSSLTGCTALTVDGLAVEACTGFTISVDLTGAAVGPREITVTNPEPSGCSATASDLFFVTDPPDVTGVMPTNICSDTASTITVTGTGFVPGATVTVAGTPADTVMVAADGNSLTASFAMGLPAGTYDVTVENSAGCADTLAAALTVDPTPIVFFVDPPVIYNGVGIEVTIFTSGLANNAQAVTLIDSMGQRTPLTAFQSPVRPNRILATVPAMLPADTYEVEVTSDIGCVSVNNGTLVITDSVTLTGLAIDPAYASPTEPTAVTITVDAATPFVSTPRAYLNPNPAAAGVTATALRAVVFADATTLTAVVPGGLTPGQYDLIVVNPTGEVGFEAQALTVTQGEPPIITAVVPATFANNADYTAEIRGLNLDATGVTVELLCEDPMGVQTTLPAMVSAVTSTTATVTIPSSSASKGSICLVTLTNSDGASFTYSAISITNSAFNLEPWAAVSPMNTARRGLGLEAGRPTFTSRFLYAVGGDDGMTANALLTVESVAVNVFGDLAMWRAERYPLPEPKTLFGLERVGRFLYAVGGNNGAQAIDTVYRAQILDPLETPEILDVDAALGDGTGLGGGLYHYRVAAIFDANDPSNPGGESLPGEVQVVDLPDLQDRIHLTLTWEQIPGASGYRVYRTPNAGDSVDALELLAEIADPATLSYTDMGGATMAGQTPLPEGSLGTWHDAGVLTTPREALTVASAQDPADPNTWYLYAFGGRDATGTYLASAEYVTITVAADGSQTIGSWTPTTATLPEGKAEIGSFRVTNDQTSVIPAGETWIYVGPGRTGATTTTGDLEAFAVVAGGDIAGFTPMNRSISTARAGYGAGTSSEFLYIFGGQGGNASNDGISAELSAPTNLLPGAWNSLGISMSDPRVFMGTTQESAFYFIAGGWSGTAPLASVDQTVQ